MITPILNFSYHDILASELQNSENVCHMQVSPAFSVEKMSEYLAKYP